MGPVDSDRDVRIIKYVEVSLFWWGVGGVFFKLKQSRGYFANRHALRQDVRPRARPNHYRLSKGMIQDLISSFRHVKNTYIRINQVSPTFDVFYPTFAFGATDFLGSLVECDILLRSSLYLNMHDGPNLFLGRNSTRRTRRWPRGQRDLWQIHLGRNLYLSEDLWEAHLIFCL